MVIFFKRKKKQNWLSSFVNFILKFPMKSETTFHLTTVIEYRLYICICIYFTRDSLLFLNKNVY